MSLKSLLAVLLTIALVGEPAVSATPMLGQVIVKGLAKVNGLVTSSGTTVFPGDRVTTETNSVAELVLNGGNKVLLPQSTAVTLSQDASQVIVNLKQGALALLSKNNSSPIIEANGVLIKPAADTAVVLEVAVRGNSLRVLARRGSAIVVASDESIEVTEGKELDATTAPASAQRPAAPAGVSRLAKWAIISVTAAAVTGLGLAVIVATRPNPADCSVGSPAGTITCP
jgi:ferric-dicitrate binding protein FerR (iron transport regulator)